MEDDNGAPVLPKTLGGKPLELVKPGSLAERWDVVILSANRPEANHRVFAAALGLCWPWFRRRFPYRGDALAYSETVINELLAAGVRFSELGAPGMEALRLCSEGLVAVEGAEAFSGTLPDGAREESGSSSSNERSS